MQSATVVVYSKSKNGIEQDSRNVFGTTIHELAHASHWEIGYSTGQFVVDAIFGDPCLPESWAVGVEWKITNDVYVKNKWLKQKNYHLYKDYYQAFTISSIVGNEGYTPLVIDMIDTYNQGIYSKSYPNDQVTGYTLAQLEDALPGSLGSWWRWKTRLKDMYNNKTENHLDYLFRTYKK